MTDKQREEYIDLWHGKLMRYFQKASKANQLKPEIQSKIMRFIIANSDNLRIFIKQLLNEAPMRKPKVSKVFVTNWILKLEEKMIVYDEGKMITHESLIEMLKEAGVEVED